MTRPLAGITLAYLLGLVLGQLYPYSFGLLWASLLIIVLFLGLFSLIKKDNVLFPYLLGIVLVLGFISGSAASREELPENHIRNFVSGESLNLEGTIVDNPEARVDRTGLILEAERLHRKEGYIPVQGRVLLSVRGTGTSLRYGDRIRFQARLVPPENFNNPGAYNYERALAWQGIYVRGTLPGLEEIFFLGKRKVPWLRGKLEEARHKIGELIDHNSSLESRGILKALVLGQQADIFPEIRRGFARAGVAHILAISGLNLAFVGGLAFLIFRLVLKSSPWLVQRLGVVLPASFLALIPVAAYSLIAGAAGFSLLRAFVMAVAYLIFLALARKKGPLDAIVFAAFLIMVFFPHAPFSVSFQLSFAAVLAIFWLGPALFAIFGMGEKGDNPGRWRRYLVGTLAVTVAATLGTVPLTAYHFNLVPLVGFLANLLVVPVTGFITVPAALLSVIAMLFSSSLAFYLVKFASLTVSALVPLVAFLAELPGAYFIVVTPNPVELVLAYGALFFLAMSGNKGWARKGLVVLTGIIFVHFAISLLSPALKREMEVNFIDVKQGDAALVRFPGGATMLIDAGGFRDPNFDVGERVVAPFLLKKRITRLNYVVATHPDVDHWGGLNYLLNNFRVDELWADPGSWEPNLWAGFVSLAAKKRIKLLSVHDTVMPREIRGAQVQVINPPLDSYYSTGSKGPGADNNRSVVVKINYDQVGFLFAGDIEKEAEARLALSGKELAAAVVKVPHHGSKTSSTAQFIDRLRPRVAVISAGSTNRLGHPAPSVIARYLERGVKVYRTDRDGAVTVLTDGRQLRVSSYLNKRWDKLEP